MFKPKHLNGMEILFMLCRDCYKCHLILWWHSVPQMCTCPVYHKYTLP